MVLNLEMHCTVAKMFHFLATLTEKETQYIGCSQIAEGRCVFLGWLVWLISIAIGISYLPGYQGWNGELAQMPYSLLPGEQLCPLSAHSGGNQGLSGVSHGTRILGRDINLGLGARRQLHSSLGIIVSRKTCISQAPK